MRQLLTTLVLIGVTWTARAQAPEPRREAAAHFNAGRWQEAATAYATVVGANPYDGAAWENLGYALHQLKRYDESIPAFTRAVESSEDPSRCMYNIACGLSLQGKRAEAMEWLNRAIAAGYRRFGDFDTDTDLDPLRGEPAFQKIVGSAPPEGASRDERWRFDIDRLMTRIGQIHYDPDRKVSSEALAAAAGDLKRRVPELSDQRVVLGLQRLLAMLGDGHSGLQGFTHGPVPFQRYDAAYYLFSDGLHVYAARGDAATVVGGRVLRLGNATAEEAVARVTPLCSVDNAMGVRSMAPTLLSLPDVLEDAGIIDRAGPVELTVAMPDGTQRTVTLEPGDGPDIRHPAQRLAGVTYANSSASAETPLWLRQPEKPQWFEHLPDLNTVYFKFNGVHNGRGTTLAQSLENLFKLVDETSAAYLIIDMRDNGGGNNTLLKPLIHGLIRRPAISQRGHLFVITGRRTFSAAMNASVRLERELDPIFVGEPTGSSPNFVGETTMVTLPASELRASISSLYWQDGQPWDHRPWIAPDILADLSSADFAANLDPAMDAVVRAIKEAHP